MTTKPIPDERLQQIKKRANAATKGPWTSGALIYDTDEKQILVHVDDSFIAGDLIQTFSGSFTTGVLSNGDDPNGAMNQAFADADFMAHAREDVPDLLAEVARLKAELSWKDDTLFVISRRHKPDDGPAALQACRELAEAALSPKT